MKGGVYRMLTNKLLEENLDEDGNPRPLKKEGKRNNGGVDWRELV